MEEQFDDIMDKLQNIEDAIEEKLNDCNKKITEMCNLQNKANEINKMNNQTILNQINQYDEEVLEHDENDKNNCVYNSLDNSNFKDNKCFIKFDKNQKDKDMFYMSSNTKNSDLKKNNQKEILIDKNKHYDNSSSTSSISKNNNKKVSNNKELEKKNESESSTSKESFILEISNDGIKTNIDTGSPRGGDVNKILSDSSKIIKNNSFNDLKKLNEIKELLEPSEVKDIKEIKENSSSQKINSDKLENENLSKYCNKDTTESDESQNFADPPLVVLNDLYKNIYNNNKSKIIEIK